MIYPYMGIYPRIHPSVFMTEDVLVIGDVRIAEDANIWFGSVIRGDVNKVEIGARTNIQDNCTVHTDLDKPTVIGDDVTVGHNAIVHGCTVENLCLIGIGAVVLNDARIKTGTVVAAGSVVRERQTVGPNQLVAGSPAVLKRELSPDIREILQGPVNSYLRLSQAHQSNKTI